MNLSTGVGGYELNLEEYWQIVVRRRLIILFCAFALGGFSWLFTWFNQPPPTYNSTAVVKVDSVVEVAYSLTDGSLAQANNMSTYLELIQSYALMERVAQRLGLVPGELSAEEIRANQDYQSQVMGLREAIAAGQEGSSELIAITATWSDPAFARDLAQAVAEEFRIFNIEEKNRRVFDAKRFIQQQLVVVGERLKAAEESMRDYRQKHNMSTFGKDSEAVARLVADFEQEYRQSLSRQNILAFTLSQLRETLRRNTWNYQGISTSGSVSDYFDTLNRRLVDLALKHTELASLYTDSHPQMVEIREQGNEILLSMVGELEKQLRLTQRRIADLQQNVAETTQRYEGLPDQALELSRMGRTVRINEELYDLLEKKYQEVLIKEAEKVQEVSLVRPAFASYVRINPVRTAQTALAGFILGFVLGLIIALILEAMDTSVGTIEEVESFLSVPVVGFVPHLSHDEAAELFSGVEGLATAGHELERQMRLITHFSPPSTISEAYRTLRTNLLFSQGGGHRVVIVSSATIKEGKSTIAANLAVVLAQQGGRILLIDADMRKPMQHHIFGLERAPGLAEVLLDQIEWRRAVRHYSDVMLGEMGIDQALLTPGLDQLDVLTCGRVEVNPPDLLATPLMQKLLDEVRQEYDLVVLDTPPLLHTTDVTVIAGKVDGVLLVYHIGAVVRGALKRVKSNIEGVGGRVFGVVLNGVRGDISPDYAKYKMDRYYNYAYGEHSRENLTLSEKVRKLANDFRKRLLGRGGRK